MSDYLGNLVARSLGPTPAVRPRLASRFEPLTPAAPAPWMEPAAAAPPALFEETVETSPEPARRRARRREVMMAEEVEPPRTAVPVPAASVPTRVATSPPDALSSGAGEGERDGAVAARRVRSAHHESFAVRTTAMPAELERTPAPALRVQTRVAEREGVPFETSPPDPLSSGAGEGERNGTVAARRVRSAHHEPFTTAMPYPLRSPSPAPLERGSGGEVSKPGALDLPLSPPTLPPLQPRITAVERQSPSIPQAAPEPVIHVTIGRIEVKAAPPPAQPSRPRSAAQAPITLEEYLRRRSRRGDG